MSVKLYPFFPIGMGFICLTVVLYEFMIWWRRRGNLYDLSFAVTCFLAGLYDIACAGEYNVDSALQSIPWLRAQAILLNLVALAFLAYLSDRTRQVPKGHFAAFAAWCAFSVIIQVIGFGSLTWEPGSSLITRVPFPFGLSVVYFEAEPGILTSIQYFFGVVFLVYFLWVTWRYGRSGHAHDARRLFWLLGVVGAAYLSDFAVSFGLYSFLYLVEYGWLAAVVFIAAQRSRDLVEAGIVKQALVASEEKFRTFIEQSSESIVMTDEAGIIIVYNKAAELLTGIPSAEVIGKPIWSLAVKAVPRARLTDDYLSGVEGHYREALASREPTVLSRQIEDAIQRPDGTLRSFRQNEFLIRTDQGYRIGTISHDVTEVMRAEQQILSSLQEKTVLLKEIHHRVKNNLQIISSLLYLQESRMDSESVRTALQDSRNQVLSMALVHEDLYRSKDFSHIDFGGYLQRLVGRLLAAYRTEGGITFIPVTQPLSLEVNQAIPCGLIVNELCTNVLRHAFPRGMVFEKRELRVELARKDEDRVLLSVSDTGVGIPAEVDPETAGTLGMQIVSRLARQIHGSLRVIRGPAGARLEIEFPLRPGGTSDQDDSNEVV